MMSWCLNNPLSDMTINQRRDNRVSLVSPTTNMNIRWEADPHLGHLTLVTKWSVTSLWRGEVTRVTPGTMGWHHNPSPPSDQWPGTNTRPLHHCRQSMQTIQCNTDSWQIYFQSLLYNVLFYHWAICLSNIVYVERLKSTDSSTQAYWPGSYWIDLL